MQHDLTVINEGVIEGRRTVKNVTKYILMGSSSNFGNMFSASGSAALFLPFLPMLPVQVLLEQPALRRLRDGLCHSTASTRAVLAQPVRWSTTLIERFMLAFGPVSSLFDFLTFFVLLAVVRSGLRHSSRPAGSSSPWQRRRWWSSSSAHAGPVLAFAAASNSGHAFDRRGGGRPNCSLDADRGPGSGWCLCRSRSICFWSRRWGPIWRWWR